LLRRAREQRRPREPAPIGPALATWRGRPDAQACPTGGANSQPRRAHATLGGGAVVNAPSPLSASAVRVVGVLQRNRGPQSVKGRCVPTPGGASTRAALAWDPACQRTVGPAAISRLYGPKASRQANGTSMGGCDGGVKLAHRSPLGPPHRHALLCPRGGAGPACPRHACGHVNVCAGARGRGGPGPGTRAQRASSACKRHVVSCTILQFNVFKNIKV